MSNLLDKASILLTPTAYNNGSMLSVKPTDGDGDFTFVRGSAATRVNAQGLVENVQIIGGELILNGDFSTNTDWTLVGDANITNGVGNFVSNGDKIFQDPILTQGKSYQITYEILNYVSGVSRVYLGSTADAFFDASANGTYSFVLEAESNTNRVQWRSDFSSTFIGSIDNCSVKEITDDTNIPRINYEGFSYDGNGDIIPNSGCGSWLLEPQSTNLITYSEDFSNSYWRKDKLTVTSNSTTSPSGDVNASLIQETSYTSSIPSIDLASTIALSASTHTCSFYVKNNSGRYLGLNFGSGVERIRTNFDFNTETFKTPIFNGTTSGEVSYVKLGDYYRISITATFPSVNNTDINLIPLATDTYPFFQFQDSDNRSFYLWGFQLEEQTHSTSYIPTSAATNTRNQDIATNSGNATLINSTEGTIYFEGSALANNGTSRRISLSDGSIRNRVSLEFDETSNRIKAFISSEAISQVLEYNSSNLLQFNKIAISYKLNDMSIWFNGSKVATDTSGNMPIGLNKLAFDNGSAAQFFFGKAKCLAVYKEALTDAELQSLTTI